MKHPVLKTIANIITEVAREEDLILSRVGKGIFLVPELAFVYSVGRALAIDAERIFSTAHVKWIPETAIGEAGRTDLVFEVEAQRAFAFEFKCGGKAQDYAGDIRKLASLDPTKYERIFVALINSWPDKIDSDSRILAVEKSSGVPTERLTENRHFDSFPTRDPDYVNQVCCVIALWRIAPEFHMPWFKVEAQTRY